MEELQFPDPLLGIILINGVHSKGNHTLSDGDILTFLPLVGGG